VGSSVPLRIGVICPWLLATALSQPAAALSFDGDLGYTSDYILRGVSESAGHSAGQIDLRVTTQGGTFAGVFASTLGRVGWNRGSDRGWNYKLEEYIGHQFALSGSWSATVTAVNYSYLDGNVPLSNDYQELSLAISYLDLWSVTVAAVPNAVRWDDGYRLGRYPAYTLESAIQVPVAGRLFAVGGAGYYTSDSTGYAYGNAGLAFEYKSLRFEVGYYLAQDRARNLFPYGRAGSRFAGTVLWHF
jgi:uncharacterized protein (TIGR02001 family)